MSDDPDPTICDLVTANQTVKAPNPICVPNDKSYCSGTNSTVDGDIYHSTVDGVYCATDGRVAQGLWQWDGNGEESIDSSGMCLGPEYHIPRGSLPDELFRTGVCSPLPGEHLCHKPLPPEYDDSVYQIAQQFGVDWKALCVFNQLKNCSTIDYIGNALKIPVRPSGR
jgi:hypothetical protein